LDLAPHKLKIVTFSRSRNDPPTFKNISLQGVDIPRIDKIKFLGVTLEKLNGKAQLKSLIIKDIMLKLSFLYRALDGASIRLFFFYYIDLFSEVLLNMVFKFLALPATRFRAGAIKKQDGDWPPRCRVAALPRPVCQSHYSPELDLALKHNCSQIINIFCGGLGSLSGVYPFGELAIQECNHF